MSKKAPCKCKPSECEECPEWIFTFADLVMLMMGFFVILWVLKPSSNPKAGKADEQKETKVFAEIRDAFGYVPNPTSKDPIDQQMIRDQMESMKIPVAPGQGAQTTVRPQGAIGTDPEVTSIRVGKQAIVGGRLLFEVGEAALHGSSGTTLQQIADQIRGHRNIVLVKGHTSLDDFGETGTPEQKMDLSLRRAQAVSDYLTTHQVSPDMLRVVGCSTFEPVVEHDYTPLAQVENRRVEVEVTPTLVGELQPAATDATDPLGTPAAGPAEMTPAAAVR